MMDLKIGSARATETERSAVDSILGAASGDSTPPSKRRGQRHHLLPTLHALNDRIGWISRGGVNYIAERLTIAPAEIFGVASFYGLFSTQERPATQTHACIDLACMISGAVIGEGEHASPCLGVCERAPARLTFEAGDPPRYSMTPEAPVAGAVPQFGDAGLVLLGRVGHVDPTSLDSYRARGGYGALRQALRLGPSGVIREINDAGLLGRGGAAFPAGRKWDAVARQPVRPHYLVCNADESEPGTFKDRVIMEGDPFSLIEAMTIAAFATGCETGYIYIRGEYPRAIDTLRAAIDAAGARGFLGPDILGSGLNFDIEVFRGAGAYICGEETAIFNSIEGFRGEPRNKPPFPVESGLFERPTLVNNVETLVNVLPIIVGGGNAFPANETKLFCLSGAVRRPGVYEVPFGTTLGQLIELGGGMTEGRIMHAILLGGAAGGFARPDELDLVLTFEATRAVGLTLGSGVVMVLDETVDMSAFLGRIAAFFRDESCGQCVPCRVGTVRQVEALESGNVDLLRDIGRVMKDASICGLGQTAHSAIESAIAKLGVLS